MQEYICHVFPWIQLQWPQLAKSWLKPEDARWLTSKCEGTSKAGNLSCQYISQLYLRWLTFRSWPPVTATIAEALVDVPTETMWERCSRKVTTACWRPRSSWLQLWEGIWVEYRSESSYGICSFVHMFAYVCGTMWRCRIPVCRRFSSVTSSWDHLDIAMIRASSELGDKLSADPMAICWQDKKVVQGQDGSDVWLVWWLAKKGTTSYSYLIWNDLISIF